LECEIEFLRYGLIALLITNLITDCGDPPAAPAGGELLGVNAVPDGAGTYAAGSIATYQCLDNHAPLGGSSTATCLPNGMWEGLDLMCPRGNYVMCPRGNYAVPTYR